MYLEVWCPVRVEIPKYNCLQPFIWSKEWTDLSSSSVSFAPRCSKVSLLAQKPTWTCDWRVAYVCRKLHLWIWMGPDFYEALETREIMIIDFVSSAPHIFLWKDIMFGWTMAECHGCEPESGSRGGGVWPWMVSSSLECREDQFLLMRLHFRWSVTVGSAVKPQSLLGAAKKSMGGPPRNSWELGFLCAFLI